MNNKINYTTFLLLLFSFGFSQNSGTETKGNKSYTQYAFIDAIKTYERLYEKGYTSSPMLLKLGNSYYFQANLEKAAKYYNELYA